MGPAEAIKTCLVKLFHFKGRASRAEFWWCVAPSFFVLSLLLSKSEGAYTQPLWEAVWSASLLFPFAGLTLFLTIGIRRSQDLGFSGIWWPVLMFAGTYAYQHLYFWIWPLESFALVASLFLTPLFLALAGILFLLPSEPTTNKYGPNPHEVPS